MTASYRTIATGSQSSGSGVANVTVAITPAVDDLFVVFVNSAAYPNPVSTCTVTDDNGGTYTQIDVAAGGGSPSGFTQLFAFVRDQKLSNTTATNVTASFTATSPSFGDSVMAVVAIAGMSNVGAAAVRSSGKEQSQAGGGTPAPALNQNALTYNVTLGAVSNATNPAALTPPASWTERADTGLTGNFTLGLEVVSRDSGFTGTTITWGGTSGSGFGDIVLELDGPAPAIHGTLSKTLDDATVAATVVHPSAHLTATLDDATVAADAAVKVKGQTAQTLGDASVSATAHRSPFPLVFPQTEGFDVSLDRVRFRFKP